jgi:hypothetical protein
MLGNPVSNGQSRRQVVHMAAVRMEAGRQQARRGSDGYFARMDRLGKSPAALLEVPLTTDNKSRLLRSPSRAPGNEATGLSVHRSKKTLPFVVAGRESA